MNKNLVSLKLLVKSTFHRLNLSVCLFYEIMLAKPVQTMNPYKNRH
ncbi:unnamed protein product [Schistosoma curassoni]|uniref:Uncharacterized protein n=1 Tax=Schistosoma curassoni TaxID=6186 RepID=A0A183K323_9TREM|nr:unnamed protein product [Schistosoma curassoni]